MKKSFVILIATIISNFAFAFETGSFECVSDTASEQKVNIKLAQVNLPSNLGPVSLPYMEYSYQDKDGNKAHAKGLAQIAGDTWSNNIDGQTIQLDSNGMKIVFKKGKAVSMIGACTKLK